LTDVLRPQPVISELNAPFYQSLAAGELKLQRCVACGFVRYPIALVCPECLGRESVWKRLSGRGAVHSTVVFHQVYNPAFADQVPYNVSIVELEEGPRLMTNVIGVDAASVAIGDPVEVVFTEIGDGAHIPQFVPRP
jgi:uncharacterized OB-fold protein